MRKPFYLGMKTELLNRLAELVWCIRDNQLGDYSPLMDEIFDAEDAIRLSVEIAPSARWLLSYMAELHPTPICSTVPLPHPTEVAKPTLGTMRGLIRRGWVQEGGMGFFELTRAGQLVASVLGKRSAELTPSDMLIKKQFENA